MYAINRILTEMGEEPLSYIEQLKSDQGVDLVKLIQINKMQAYYLSSLFYPRSIVYRRDFEYVEKVFNLCGDNVLEAYINLLKYYSFVHTQSNGQQIRYNISVLIDMFSNSTDIETIVTVEENSKLRLRAIKLPISTLGNKTILYYSLNPETLLKDILYKSNVKILYNTSDDMDIYRQRYIMLIYDINDVDINFNFYEGYEIGTAIINQDTALFHIADNVYAVYVKGDTIFNFAVRMEDFCSRYQTDTELLYVLYQTIVYKSDRCSLSDFLNSLRGYIKMYIDVPHYNKTLSTLRSYAESKKFIKSIGDDSATVNMDKLYAYLVNERAGL